MTYLRFSAMTFVLAMGAFLVAMDLGWAAALLAYAIFTMIVVDEYKGNSRKTFKHVQAFALNSFLHVTLPLLFMLTAVFATYLSHTDPFGVIAGASYLGFDIAASRAEAGPLHIFFAVLSLGFLYGTAGINVAHELFHRTHSWFDVVVARWLLAFSCDTTFAIEHVYGHHRHVGTLDDPATARRGESIVSFWIRSTSGEIANAFRYEAGRLARRGLTWVHWKNRAIRGQILSLVLVAAMYYAAGWLGVVCFLATALVGKLTLECINYTQHYGLVRVEGTKVAARHSWDCYRLMSNALLYNLPRHSAHHLNASLKFWELQAGKDAQMMPMGYMPMILLSLVPPLWRRTMHPLLKQWDEQFASEAELKFIAQQGWVL